MHYESEIQVDADPHAVVDQATQILLSVGFQVVEQTKLEVTYDGPGMRSTNQNPLLGATTIKLIEREHPTRRILVQADLGGVDWMNKFMTRFPTALALGICGLFAVILVVVQFAGGAPIPPWTWGILAVVFLGNTVPWLFIAPAMTKRIRAKTERTIDDMIRSADQIALREATNVA